MDFIKLITYKPGFRLEAAVDKGEAIIMTISTKAPDSKNPGHEIVVAMSMRLMFEEIKDEEQFKKRLRTFVLGFETHEMDEWLKIDGKHVRAPHDSN